MNKAIFLDRDNTIIWDKHYLNDPNDIEYIPGVFEALSLLHSSGYLLIIVSNQSGIAKGIVSLENLEEIHKRIKMRLQQAGCPLHDIFYCPADSNSNDPDRKPKPGMLIKAKNKHQIDMSQSWMIGDKESDVEAGHNAGCRSILFLPTGKTENKTEADFETNSIVEAADFILKFSNKY
tara:strand:+ start:2896 stop:3429 length:534 start_codon:yes stop_codon:yes gene_type:complete